MFILIICTIEEIIYNVIQAINNTAKCCIIPQTPKHAIFLKQNLKTYLKIRVLHFYNC